MWRVAALTGLPCALVEAFNDGLNWRERGAGGVASDSGPESCLHGPRQADPACIPKDVITY